MNKNFDKVHVMSANENPYADMARLKGVDVIEHWLHPQTFAIDVAGIKAAIRPDTRLLYCTATPKHSEWLECAWDME